VASAGVVNIATNTTTVAKTKMMRFNALRPPFSTQDKRAEPLETP
jgi:hypothetical protein